ncbi:MAG: HD domain-containing protein [Reichenbachiella sp.]
MPESTEILSEVRTYVSNLLSDHLPDNFYYHNLTHTKEVVEVSLALAKHERISKEDLNLLEIAAWFHDLGHVFVEEEHELKSIELARDYLAKTEMNSGQIEKVCNCIKATIMPQSPQNKMEEVLCDADLFHLSTDKFEERSELLMQELNEVNDAGLDDAEWMQKSFDFLRSHEYFTPHAKQNYDLGKIENLKKAKKKLKKKIEKMKPTRGIETMFRTTSKNHLELSAIADNKANIMISINSIILSIIVSVLIRKLEEYPHFVIPTLIMTVVCLSTIVLSILATRPNVQKGRFTKEDINNRKVNLLFFGNFHKMSLGEYEWGMKEMMKDGEYLYGSMIKDIYFLGAVLGKKYKLLRWSYTVFMFGFVLAVLAFVIAEIFFKQYYMY